MRPLRPLLPPLVPTLRILLLAAVAAAGACAPPPEPTADAPLRIVVSVPPQAWLVERLAGPRAETTVLLPPGAAPEIVAPSPRQMVALTRADLVVLVGHPAFAFETRHVLPVLQRHPEIPTVSMAAAVGLDAGETGADGHGHHHDGASDPHVWVSPRLVRDAVGAIAGVLARVDGTGSDLYFRRLGELRSEIDALDAEIRRELAGAEGRTFLVYHPAWSHFAEDYGLEQMAIETEGKEPSARHMVELVEAAREASVRVVFAQEGLPSRGARTVAEEIGARVVPLDPLSRDWPGTLRTLARAVGNAPGAAGPVGRTSR